MDFLTKLPTVPIKAKIRTSSQFIERFISSSTTIYLFKIHELLCITFRLNLELNYHISQPGEIEMKDFWNKRYQETDFVYGTQPNVYFKEQIDLLKQGSLILPADGEGRNAVYAASKGWDVTAVDYSEEGRDKALRLANAKDVEIQYHLSDLSAYDFSPTTYDAAAFIYVHLPRSIIEIVYQNVIKSLKKGATVIVEVYSFNQLGRDSGGPQDERVLYTKDRLGHLLSGTEIQLLEEQEVELREGKYHDGKAMVLRALATRS